MVYVYFGKLIEKNNGKAFANSTSGFMNDLETEGGRVVNVQCFENEGNYCALVIYRAEEEIEEVEE